MVDIYKLDGPEDSKRDSQHYQDMNKKALASLGKFLNDEILAIYSPYIAMNAVTSIMAQIIVSSDYDLEDFLLQFGETVKECKEYLKRVKEEENASGKD